MINSNRSDRIGKIKEVLDKQGNATTLFLAKSLNKSESSIRRDINYMVDCGDFPNLRRVYGGIILENLKGDQEIMFKLKLSLNKLLKRSIARKAIEFISPRDSIILDSGTTCLYLAEQLRDIPGLCVITADIMIAEELGKHSNIESSIIGGIVRPGYYTIGGIRALENLESFSAKTVFMSVDAIDIDHGVTNASEFEVGVKKRLLQKKSQIYIIADHTKLDTHTIHKVAPLSSIKTIITDDEVSPSVVEKFTNAGIEVVLA